MTTAIHTLSLHDALPISTVAEAGDKLTLTSGTTVVSLQDREVAEPDLPLTGTTWTVDTLLAGGAASSIPDRSEEHTSELQSLRHLVCRLLLEKKTSKKVD